MNVDAVRAICEVPGIEVELGGGLRSLVDIEKVLALGVEYVVLGTAAVERLGLVEEACRSRMLRACTHRAYRPHGEIK